MIALCSLADEGEGLAVGGPAEEIAAHAGEAAQRDGCFIGLRDRDGRRLAAGDRERDQIDFAIDQRHRLTFAAVYKPRLEQLTNSDAGRKALSGWTLSTVMEFSSGRPYAGLLSPACTSATLSFSNCGNPASAPVPGNDNLNDTAFNQDTANTAGGINGAGPTPGIGLNSFYGPWLERIDVGLARSFEIREGKELQFQAQAFNLFNHANYYVQNGDGINQLQYNPIGTNCGDGMSTTQQCYLVPNSGPGNFGSYGEISPNGLPRVLQFSARFTF